MTEHGVVALDPVALVRLEATLHGIAGVYRRRAGKVAEALAGTGEGAGPELAELHRVVEWCELHRDDINRRRRILSALPVALPRPARAFGTAEEARVAAEGVAGRLVRALDRRPPTWAVLADLLAEVEWGGHDGAFAARLLNVLGPRRTALLPLWIERSARAAGVDRLGGAVEGAQAAVAGALLAASHHTGRDRLSPGWSAAFAGLDHGAGAPAHAPDAEPDVQARLEALGFGADLARALALGIGAGTVATVLSGADKVLAVARVGGGEADGWDVAGTGVGLAGSFGMLLVTTGIVSAPLGVAALLGGSVVASAVAWFLHQVEAAPEEQATSENRRRRHARTHDPATGTARFPGGGTDQPHQDGAGGVLPPNMVR